MESGILVGRRRSHESNPGPRDPRHRSQEARCSNHNQILISLPHPHPHLHSHLHPHPNPHPHPYEDYMHYTTHSSHRPRIGYIDSEDSLDDDSFDEGYSDDEAAHSTRLFSGHHRPRGHGFGHTRGPDSRLHASTTDTDGLEDDDYDHHPRDREGEVIRHTSRHGPISRSQHRLRSPPPHRLDHCILRTRIPPSPFILGPPPLIRSSRPYSAGSRRPHVGIDAPPHSSQRRRLIAHATHPGETYHDARSGRPPGNGRGGFL